MNNTYQKLKKQLINHEGLRYTVYFDTAKPPNRTIGIGHNIDAKGLPVTIAEYLDRCGQITVDMVNQLFSQDISDATSACTKLYPEFHTFSEHRRLALIDFLFNVGIGTAKTFKNTNRCINAGDWTGVIAHLKDSLWYRQVKIRGDNIMRLIKEG
jgi:lysozyme